MRKRLVLEVKRRGIKLRQSYERLSEIALVMKGRMGKARKGKKMRREVRKLKRYLGCVLRDIKRRCSDPDRKMGELLELGERIFRQRRKDKGKVYSVHEPEVECLGKGKVHKKYEFGNKVSVVTTSWGNWCVGIRSFHGNPFDGRTLVEAMEQMLRLTGKSPDFVQVDKGYRGKKYHPEGMEVCLPKKRKEMSRTERKHQRRRNAVESVISHLKWDHSLGRNYLKGREGDEINAMLSGSGYNLRKLMRTQFFLLFFWIGLKLRNSLKDRVMRNRFCPTHG